MQVVNVHTRALDAPAEEVGRLIDSLASEDDLLWPRDRWPAMRFDRPLQVGAVGGHGRIGYVVEVYEPGHNIRFRFTRPEGYMGSHRFEVEETGPGQSLLRHVIEMEVTGRTWLSWAVMIRPLHDALIEDALDRAQVYSGGQPAQRGWPAWVRFLRWALSRRRRTKPKRQTT